MRDGDVLNEGSYKKYPTERALTAAEEADKTQAIARQRLAEVVNAFENQKKTKNRYLRGFTQLVAIAVFVGGGVAEGGKLKGDDVLIIVKGEVIRKVDGLS